MTLYGEVKVTQLYLTLCDPMDYIQSMGFSRPGYWSGQLFPSPGDLPNPGIEHKSPALRADSLAAEPSGSPRISRCKLLYIDWINNKVLL